MSVPSVLSFFSIFLLVLVIPSSTFTLPKGCSCAPINCVSSVYCCFRFCGCLGAEPFGFYGHRCGGVCVDLRIYDCPKINGVEVPILETFLPDCTDPGATLTSGNCIFGESCFGGLCERICPPGQLLCGSSCCGADSICTPTGCQPRLCPPGSSLHTCNDKKRLTVHSNCKPFGSPISFNEAQNYYRVFEDLAEELGCVVFGEKEVEDECLEGELRCFSECCTFLEVCDPYAKKCRSPLQCAHDEHECGIHCCKNASEFCLSSYCHEIIEGKTEEEAKKEKAVILALIGDSVVFSYSGQDPSFEREGTLQRPTVDDTYGFVRDDLPMADRKYLNLENAQGLLTSLQEDYEIVVRAGTYTSFDSDAIKQIVAKVGDNEDLDIDAAFSIPESPPDDINLRAEMGVVVGNLPGIYIGEDYTKQQISVISPQSRYALPVDFDVNFEREESYVFKNGRPYDLVLNRTIYESDSLIQYFDLTVYLDSFLATQTVYPAFSIELGNKTMTITVPMERQPVKIAGIRWPVYSMSNFDEDVWFKNSSCTFTIKTFCDRPFSTVSEVTEFSMSFGSNQNLIPIWNSTFGALFPNVTMSKACSENSKVDCPNMVSIYPSDELVTALKIKKEEQFIFVHTKFNSSIVNTSYPTSVTDGPYNLKSKQFVRVQGFPFSLEPSSSSNQGLESQNEDSGVDVDSPEDSHSFLTIVFATATVVSGGVGAAFICFWCKNKQMNTNENGHQQLSAIVPAAASDNSPTVGDSTADTQT